MGAVVSATPTEYGNDFVATKDDMEKYAATATSLEIPVSMGKDELQWMSQWSEEEELMVDYSSELRSSWSPLTILLMGLIFVLVIGYGGAAHFELTAGKKG